jgi:hypothetical protein
MENKKRGCNTENINGSSMETSMENNRCGCKTKTMDKSPVEKPRMNNVCGCGCGSGPLKGNSDKSDCSSK